MDLLILGNEVFYLLLYLNFYLRETRFNLLNGQVGIWQLSILTALPIYLLKQATNVFKLQAAAQEIAKLDLVKNQGYFILSGNVIMVV